MQTVKTQITLLQKEFTLFLIRVNTDCLSTNYFVKHNLGEKAQNSVLKFLGHLP